MEMLLNQQHLCFVFVLVLFCGFRSKQSMRDDIRKTKTSIFLSMVEEKLLLHGGVNGLVSDVNYQL